MAIKKTILVTLTTLSIIGILLYRCVYKSHRDIQSERADYQVAVDDLQREFTSNDSLAYLKYRDKTIEINAMITAVDIPSGGIVLEDKVYAVFNVLPEEIFRGKKIKIKGRFLGYDDLLEEFKIDQCAIVN
ncbi:MAG: hypothetical protein EOO20_00775 [Chryseobacterium sp.]|nr:MAG: hypothetical protein EOO20_00775 [Chryseobacterium sp.]